jgi:hypothetical protein
MVRWLSKKFPECTVTSEVVAGTCKAGAITILQFFNENDRRLLEQNADAHSDLTTVGHAVEWGGWAMETAIRCHRADIMWWLHANIPDAEYDLDAALESAIKCGEIFAAEWLLAQGPEWPGFDGQPAVALAVASAGRLNVLKWLETKGEVDDLVGLVVHAA